MAKKVCKGQTIKDFVHHIESLSSIGSGNGELMKDIKENNMIMFTFWQDYSGGYEIDGLVGEKLLTEGQRGCWSN